MVLNNITRTTVATLTDDEWLGSWLADHLKMIILLLRVVSVLHDLLSDVLIGRSCLVTPDTTLRIGMDQERYAARAPSRAGLSFP